MKPLTRKAALVPCPRKGPQERAQMKWPPRDPATGWSHVQALPAMGSPAQNKISSPHASLARFRRGDRPRSLSLHPFVSTNTLSLGAGSVLTVNRLKPRRVTGFFSVWKPRPLIPHPGSVSPRSGFQPTWTSACSGHSCPAQSLQVLVTWPGMPSLHLLPQPDSQLGVPGRGGGAPHDNCPDSGRRHLSHSLGAAPRLVVCPPPQEACLLPSGPGLPEPQVCRGLGVPSVGPPPAPPSCPPWVCWGSPCQAGCVHELSALTSVSAFLCSLLPSIDVLLQTCFQGETLLPAPWTPSCPWRGGGACSQSPRDLPESRKSCTPHLKRQCGEPESGQGFCDPHGRSPVLAGAHLPRDGRVNLAEPAWGGQLGHEGPCSFCCWLS